GAVSWRPVKAGSDLHRSKLAAVDPADGFRIALTFGAEDREAFVINRVFQVVPDAFDLLVGAVARQTYEGGLLVRGQGIPLRPGTGFDVADQARCRVHVHSLHGRQMPPAIRVYGAVNYHRPDRDEVLQVLHNVQADSGTCVKGRADFAEHL